MERLLKRKNQSIINITNVKLIRTQYMLLIKTIFRFLLITILLMVNSNALSQETTYLRQDNKASFDTTKINTSAEKVHDDYVRPELFSEGKRWVAWHGNLYLGPNNLFDYNNIEPNFLFYISVDGDEVIDGKSCKRIKLQTQYLGDSCGIATTIIPENIRKLNTFISMKKEIKSIVIASQGNIGYLMKMARKPAE